MTQHSLLETMSLDLGVPTSLIEKILLRAPYTYKTYKIPKKNGEKRTISQPARETKFLQNWLIENIFKELPVHENATAYKEGASIKKNALAHVNEPYLVKYDFSNFFTSIKAIDISKFLKSSFDGKLTDDDIKIVTRIVCKHTNDNGLCLSIGAPSSPIVSNVIMYQFDVTISDWAVYNGFKYTRYADDLTFSTSKKNVSDQVQNMLETAIQDLIYPKLSLNQKKTIHLSKKSRRTVTGVTIDNTGNLSLGRDRKRLISATIHKHITDGIDAENFYKLQGILGFAKDIEPQFINRMCKKYGSEKISEILSSRRPAKNARNK